MTDRRRARLGVASVTGPGSTSPESAGRIVPKTLRAAGSGAPAPMRRQDAAPAVGARYAEILLVLLVVLGAACAGPERPGSGPGTTRGRGATRAPVAPPATVVPRAEGTGASPTRADVEEGLASYYSRGLAGRRTASGERYDPGQPTAAHRSLPFGSVVRVERLDAQGEATGKVVQVRINDRGPFVQGRIIDLSGSAARRLGIEEVGIAPVRVRVLSRP